MINSVEFIKDPVVVMNENLTLEKVIEVRIRWNPEVVQDINSTTNNVDVEDKFFLELRNKLTSLLSNYYNSLKDE